MSVFLKLINRNTIKTTNVLSSTLKRCSTASNSFMEYDKDPRSKFLDSDTQKLLKSLTRMELAKVFRKRAVPRSEVEYKFLTTEQIENEVKAAVRRAYDLLQMPPVVPIQRKENKIISKDAALHSFDESNYIFTDITYGLNDNERRIVVRHTDGILQNASDDIRKRMNSIYFPMAGRRFHTPHMFEPEHLNKCLDQQYYEFILDRACIQFEPYEPDFHRITSDVYLHINKMKEFDKLRSTRHFGPMAFFLSWHKMIDLLLIDMIDRDFLKNGVELIYLYNRINDIECDTSILYQLNEMDASANLIGASDTHLNNSITEDHIRSVGKNSENLKMDSICLKFIETYVKEGAIQKSAIESSLQNYRLMHEERIRLSDGLFKAHGLR